MPKSKQRETIIQEMKEIVASDQIIVNDSGHSIDRWPLTALQEVLGSQFEKPICAVKPKNTKEVSKVLSYLNENKIPVVPYGGGSGVVGGAKPNSESVVVDVGSMDQILHLDEENLTVTAQTAVFHGRLEEWLNEHGYISGHYPQSIDLAHIGGLVATRSAGQLSTKYGNIEDILVGLEAVLPNGEVIRLKEVTRSSTGPDLRQVWLGSEGALGIITEVTIRVMPKPAGRWMQAYGIRDMRQGLDMIQKFMREGWKPAAVRLHDDIEAAEKYADFIHEGESILLLLSEGPKEYTELEGKMLDKIITEKGGRALGTGPMEEWLEKRNDVSNIEGPIQQGILMDTSEISANWTNIANVYENVIKRLKDEIPELVRVSAHSSHSYLGGTNLYFIFGAKVSKDTQELERVYRSIWSRIMETTLENGGSIAHHHGVGELRAPWMPKELGSAYPMLKAIKDCLDPNGIMNPGKLLPQDENDK